MTDKKTQNLAAPLRKDSFQIWQRSWAVIRFKADAPGMWQFHCHMEQHIPLGMIMALNVLPSKQPKIPKSVPTEGPCPVWSSPAGQVAEGGAKAAEAGKFLATENARLEQRVKELEEQVKASSSQCGKTV